ncbi:hypothetical protein N2152v2_010317 [Parachlorella kessleri]
MTRCCVALKMRAGPVSTATAQKSWRHISVQALPAVPLQRSSFGAAPASQYRVLAAPCRAYSADPRSWAPQQEGSISEVDYDAALVNSVTLIGGLGRDVEVRTFENNKVASFSLAVTWNKSKGITHWYTVEAFGPLADRVAAGLRKGNQVLVEGRLRTDSWETKEGAKRKDVRIQAKSIHKIKRYEQGQEGFRNQDDSFYTAGSYSQAADEQQHQQQWGSGSGNAQTTSSYSQQQGQQQYKGSSSGGGQQQQQTSEELWMELFQRPEEWNDFRQDKAAGLRKPNFPDFKRKQGGE